MSQGTILLTGATGLVGFRVLEKLLDQGSHVRLVVRSESKFSALERSLALAKKDTAGVEHVVVPDMMQEGAFNDAIRGVSYVIHVASPPPRPVDDREASIIKPAVANTVSLLHSALRSPERSIKKVVITSSVAAVWPSKPQVFDADNIVPDPRGPYPDDFAAYSASKKLAYKATREIIAEHKPYFDIVNVMPTFIIGPNGFAASRKDYELGSNSIAMAPLLGINLEGPKPGAVCHVDDVAVVHVEALDPGIVGHRNFGVNFDGMNGVEWNSAIDIVKNKLLNAVGANGFPLDGSVTTVKLAFDASKTERELGMTFKSFETMIVDLARAYLEADTGLQVKA